MVGCRSHLNTVPTSFYFSSISRREPPGEIWSPNYNAPQLVHWRHVERAQRTILGSYLDQCQPLPTTKSKGLARGRCLDLPTKVVFDGDSSQILDKCSLYGPPTCPQGRLSLSVFQGDSRVGLPAKLRILRSSLRLSASNAKDRRSKRVEGVEGGRARRNKRPTMGCFSATSTAPLH